MKMPKIPGGLGQMQKLMEEANRMMEQAQQFESEMEQTHIEASAGGGVVKAVVNGKGAIVALHIQPEVVDPSDVDMLQDLILGAIREAQQNAETMRAEKMGKLTGGLPPGLGIPGF
ncbi:MAG: YbaB/EbfC family nucleoid-associated protein [Fimbriimonadia bacterium]|nr:YbaB/EbfC family nucleoid-associated protein [Fimbriimonadia bacterium]